MSEPTMMRIFESLRLTVAEGFETLYDGRGHSVAHASYQVAYNRRVLIAPAPEAK